MSEESINPAEDGLPLDFLGDGTEPLEVNSITVDADGNVTRRVPPSPFNFCFTYLEIPFSARVSEDGGNKNLNVTADFGPMPYTAEAPKLRKPLLALLDALKAEGTFRLSLNTRKRIMLAGEIPMEAALTPVNIIASLTTLLVHTDPYLDLISDQFMHSTPPQAANSNVNGESANDGDDQVDDQAGEAAENND